MTTRTDLVSSPFRYFQAATLLLIVGSFLDNIRGPLLPLLTEALHLTYGESSWLLVSGNIVSIISTFLLIPLLQRFSERNVSLASIILAVFACILGMRVTGLSSLLLFASALGIAVGTLGAMCNIMALKGASPEKQGKYLSGLHMVYGIGSLLAPLALMTVGKFGLNWSVILGAMLPLLGGIYWFVSRLPPAVDVPANTENVSTMESLDNSSTDQKKVVNSSVMFRREHFLFLVLVGFYVAGEVLTSSWLVTYLIEVKGMEFSDAAWQMSLFFLVLTGSRLLNILIFNHKSERIILIAVLALPIIFFSLAYLADLKFLFPLVGLVGPFFPILLSGLKTRFEDFWKSLTVWVIVFMQGFIGAAHWVMGHLFVMYSPQQAFLLPLICFLCAATLMWVTWNAFFHRKEAGSTAISDVVRSN